MSFALFLLLLLVVTGVVWALGRQSHRVRRSPGIELARRLLEHAAAAGWRVALVGASPAVMEQLQERLALSRGSAMRARGPNGKRCTQYRHQMPRAKPTRNLRPSSV